MSKKFIGYFRLLEACEEEGCPVCRCVLNDTRKQLESFLYENVNDPAFRANLHQSWGFCAWHASLLKSTPDFPFGAAIVCSDLLEGLLKKIQNERIVAREFSRKKVCPFCWWALQSESQHISALLDFADDLQMERAYAKSDGICFPHFLVLTEAGKRKPGLAKVARLTQAKWSGLLRELKAFVEKHDWQKRSPFTHEEARASRLALEILAGKEGIFPNEMLESFGKKLGDFKAPFPEPDIPPTEPEIIKFEKQKLELQINGLLSQLNEATSRSASLNYKVWELSEAKKTLEFNLTGLKAESEMSLKVIQSLREENKMLRQKLEG